MPGLAVIQPSASDSVCASCKRIYGNSCCEFKDNGVLMPLTYNEADRLARGLGREIHEVVDVRNVTKEEIEELRSATEQRVSDLVVDGKAFYLPTDHTEQCRYLGPAGCTIPHLKPHLCTLFPFSKSGNRWRVGAYIGMPGFCLGYDTAGGRLPLALDLFGTSIKSLERTRKLWMRDMASHVDKMRRYKRGNGNRRA